MKSWIWLLRLAALALASILLSEIVLRAVHPFVPVPEVRTGSYNDLRRAPFTPSFDGFALNSKGFNDLEFTEEKAQGTTRILGIGDSFAHGVVPYKNNYLTLLEQYLQADQEQLEIINMGIPNLDVASYHALWLEEGMLLNPDFVLLGLYIGNDLSPSRRLNQRTSSYVFTLLRYAYTLWTQVEHQPRERNRVYEDSNPSIREDTYQRLLTRKLWIFKREKPQFLPHFPKILEYLDKIRRSCEAKDIGFLVVILPEELQVDEEVRATIFAAKLNLRPEDFDFDLPNRMLQKEFERLGIEYLDLLPAMREMAKTRKIYKPRNTHWNLLGNRLAAQEIYPRLKEELIPYWGVDR